MSYIDDEIPVDNPKSEVEDNEPYEPDIPEDQDLVEDDELPPWEE